MTARRYRDYRDRQPDENRVRNPSTVALGPGWRTSYPEEFPVTVRRLGEPLPGHITPHFGAGGLCQCSCADCVTRLFRLCVCLDCPCDRLPPQEAA